jgi:hypothetical protein
MRAALVLTFVLVGCHKDPPPTPPPAPAVTATQNKGEGEAAQRRASKPLAVLLNGQPGPTWTPEKVNAVPFVHITNGNGEDREGWSLHDLTKALVGPNARVTAMVDGAGERVEVTPPAWNDPKKTLVVRVTRRGDYKVHWASADGTVSDAILKGIQRLEIAQ